MVRYCDHAWTGKGGHNPEGDSMFVCFPSPGEKDIPGLTDTTIPRRLGPKRASKIRKLFNLSKEDDVRQYVVRRPIVKEGMYTSGLEPSKSMFAG